MLRTTSPDVEVRNVTFWKRVASNRYKRTYIITRDDKYNKLVYAGKIKGRHYPMTRSMVNSLSLSVKGSSESQALKEIKDAKTS